MGAEKTRAHPDCPRFRETPRGAKHLAFAANVEAVAGLDLYCADPFGDQRVQPRQRLFDKFVFAGCARR